MTNEHERRDPGSTGAVTGIPAEAFIDSLPGLLLVSDACDDPAHRSRRAEVVTRRSAEAAQAQPLGYCAGEVQGFQHGGAVPVEEFEDRFARLPA